MGWPRISQARLAITSFAFMLLWVPEPVCQTTRGKWSSRAPAITSPAAWSIARPSPASSRPASTFTRAAACLMMPSARISGAGMRSPPILKFCRLRCVWAPQ